MKNLFLFAVIASLLFAVSCDKKEMKPGAKLTKLEELQKMAQENGGLVVEVRDKSSNILDSLNIEGNLYNYYPDNNDLQNVQTIFIAEQGINDVKAQIDKLQTDKGIAPTYKTGTLVVGHHFIDCTTVFSNCLVYSGIIFY